MGIGKWIGGIIGFMALGLWALWPESYSDLCLMKGSIRRDRHTAEGVMKVNPPGRQIRASETASLFSMLVMASYIIKADGRIMHSEMEFVRQFLRRNFGEMAVSQGNRFY